MPSHLCCIIISIIIAMILKIFSLPHRLAFSYLKYYFEVFYNISNKPLEWEIAPDTSTSLILLRQDFSAIFIFILWRATKCFVHQHNIFMFGIQRYI